MQSSFKAAPPFAPSRRTFLKAASAAGVMVSWPGHGHAMATHTRKSLQGGNVADDLQIYTDAVNAMLNLPPEDPRNWYRHAMTHMMDCPHGNWWFLVWHRGYLAHLESICREVTGEADFALPFWDWTVETKIPDAFWQGVLNPTAPEFEADQASFDARFRGPMEDYWNSLDTAQMDQQMARGMMLPPQLAYDDFDSFWNSMAFHFVGSGVSRNLTQPNPNLGFGAQLAVLQSTITDALAPIDFVTDMGAPGFESGVTSDHHMGAPQSIIESQPHNQVHGSIGGLMGFWLSPADPIFFMHHCNIDRLWDVWTRKQLANGRPAGPPASMETAYKEEPFLFFHDANGDPATLQMAGDYENVATFDYDYEPGTGEDQVPVVVAGGTPVVNEAAVTESAFDIAAPAFSSLALSESLAAAINSDDRRLFAEVSINPPEDVSGLEFLVFVGKAGADIDTSDDSPNLAGAVNFFGDVTHGTGPAGFTLGITETVRRLRADGALAAGDELQVAVVPKAREGVLALSGNAEGALAGATIGAL